MTPGFTCERWDGEEARRRAGEIWPLYDEVFADHDDEQQWRERSLDPHSRREGFVLVVALADDALPDEDVVGFSYAYVGARGQWFSDRAAAALGAEADAWVGGHVELVELAVRETWRRRGVGARLHDLVLQDRGPRCALLATDARDSDAVRLYEARGWRTLGAFGPGARLMGLPAGS